MLQGEMVRLLAVDRENLPKFLRWVNDPEVTQFLMVDPPLGMEQEEAWFEGLRDREALIFTIQTMEGEVIGNCGLEKISWKDRKATLGIMIGSKMHWDKGYGTDAVRALLKLCFHELNLMRVCLICDQSNVRAQRAYEKCGFSREGVMRAYRYKNGAYVDEVLMSILQPEWLERQKRS
jgi:RimJ/RimL family protein N-acetyltransferase